MENQQNNWGNIKQRNWGKTPDNYVQVVMIWWEWKTGRDKTQVGRGLDLVMDMKMHLVWPISLAMTDCETNPHLIRKSGMITCWWWPRFLKVRAGKWCHKLAILWFRICLLIGAKKKDIFWYNILGRNMICNESSSHPKFLTSTWLTDGSWRWK